MKFNKMKKMGYHYIAVLLILISVAGCGNKKQKPAQLPPLEFHVQTMKRSSVKTFFEFPTSLEGERNVEIRPKISGILTKIHVDEGDYVRKGQKLFSIETETLTEDANVAKASVDLAEIEVARLEPLIEKGIIGQSQLVTAKANLEKARAGYRSILANIEYGTIKSPVDGLVGLLPYKEGSLVNPSMPTPITVISDISNIRSYFSLNEKQYLSFFLRTKGITIKEKVKNEPNIGLILADGTKYNYPGKIELIAGQINSRTGSIETRAVFPNPTGILRHGSSGRVQVPFQLEDVYIVPQKALQSLQDKQFLYCVGKDNKVFQKNVEVEGEFEDKFVIKKGIEDGDRVVIEGVIQLKEDMEIIPKE